MRRCGRDGGRHCEGGGRAVPPYAQHGTARPPRTAHALRARRRALCIIATPRADGHIALPLAVRAACFIRAFRGHCALLRPVCAVVVPPPRRTHLGQEGRLEDLRQVEHLAGAVLQQLAVLRLGQGRERRRVGAVGTVRRADGGGARAGAHGLHRLLKRLSLERQTAGNNKPAQMMQ